MATFSIHFDGPITVNHQLSLRVLAKTYENMQRAIDRAYLVEKYGEVWKHARLKAEDYAVIDFVAAYPREGGIYLDALRDGDFPRRAIDRVFRAISPVFERSVQAGIEQFENLDQQLLSRQKYVQGAGDIVRQFEEVRNNPPDSWAENYSNRAVLKEIDQIASQITSERLEGSVLDISLQGTRAHPSLGFTADMAKRFHAIAARRDLGPPMIVTARIRMIDRGSKNAKPSAKILNISTEREVNLHLSSIADCNSLHPYHNGQDVRLYVCPIIEALGFDIVGGDLMFLGIA